jgi:CubicO group peptidase (beta-lactamase class C family)
MFLPFVTLASVLLVSSCRGATVPNGQTFDATSCLDEHIVNAMKANNLPGASLAVLRRGELAYEQGYGTRDAPGVGDEDGRPALPSTPFRIMSITKVLTASTVLLLAQEGLLGLDDVVFGEGGVLRFMTEGHDNIDPMMFDITIRHILRHSAGFTPQLDPDDPLKSDPLSSSIYISSELTWHSWPGQLLC